MSDQPETTNTNQIKIISWNPISVWTFDLPSTTCDICKRNITLTCVECSTNKSTECIITKGNCGHGFHDHCIQKWLKPGTICPTCRTPWNTQVGDLNNDTDWKKIVPKNKAN